MQHPFLPGQIIACVDVSHAGHSPNVERLVLGRLYRVAEALTNDRGEFGVTLEGVDHRPARGWHHWRFKPLHSAEGDFKRLLHVTSAKVRVRGASSRSAPVSRPAFPERIAVLYEQGREQKACLPATFITGITSQWDRGKYFEKFGQRPPQWLEEVQVVWVSRLCRYAINQDRLLPDQAPVTIGILE